MTEYKIGQIFEEMYPEKAAEWCNGNNAYIEEIEAKKGVRRFEIKAVPEPSEEEIKQRKIEKLKKQLSEVDSKKIRSMSAIVAETATDEDVAYLKDLEAQAQEIRKEIQELS